jgi:hypothetical protein
MEHTLKNELGIPASRLLFAVDGAEALEMIKNNLLNF